MHMYMHMYNAHVQYTCIMHMYNAHVQSTCIIHMYNTHVMHMYNNPPFQVVESELIAIAGPLESGDELVVIQVPIFIRIYTGTGKLARTCV